MKKTYFFTRNIPLHENINDAGLFITQYGVAHHKYWIVLLTIY